MAKMKKSLVQLAFILLFHDTSKTETQFSGTKPASSLIIVGTFIGAISWAVICFLVPNYISLRCKICCYWLQFYNLFSAILQFFSSKSTNSFDIILVKPILFFSRSILKSIFENTITSFVIQMKYLQYFPKINHMIDPDSPDRRIVFYFFCHT